METKPEKKIHEDDTLTCMFGMRMNKDIFADMMKTQLWFDASLELGKLNPKPDFSGMTTQAKSVLHQKAFGLIFGGYGLEKDLDMAEKLIRRLLKQNDNTTDDFSFLGEEMAKQFKAAQQNTNKIIQQMEKVHMFGAEHILLGTIYAYKNDYVKSAYHLMTGIKTVNLNMPYYDFIQYILNKLKQIDIKQAELTGRGFESVKPMGFIACGQIACDTRAALNIIPELESDNSGIVLAKMGRTKILGYLERKGSDFNNNVCVDIYETYLIDKDYNLKSVRFYFNGYYNLQEYGKRKVILPNGFTITNNRLHTLYDFVKLDESDKCLICGTETDNQDLCAECRKKQDVKIFVPVGGLR